MRLPVTYLFVPADRPDRFPKALASGADAIILDLEDSVAPARKQLARDAIVSWLPTVACGTAIIVRINDHTTLWHTADLTALAAARPAAIMLPKAEHPDQITGVATQLARPIIPLIETALGVRNVDSIAATPGVDRLAFGTIDFALDLNLAGDDPALGPAAFAIALAARGANLPGPVAGVTAAISDPAALDRDIAFARAHGYTAKLCIHPSQVAPTRSGFAPTDAEIAWASRVLAAAASTGATQVDGQMVDRPVILRAQAILDRIQPTAT